MPGKQYSAEERATLKAMADAHRQGGWTSLTPTEIADRTGLPPQRVRDWLDILEKAGAVEGDEVNFDSLDRNWTLTARGRLVNEGALRDEESSAGHTITMHGDQARVNLNSIDASTNVIKQGGDEKLFEELRATLATIEDDTLRTDLQRQADAMEASASKPDLIEKIQQFTTIGQSVMTVLGPYLPRLLGLAQQSLGG